MKYYIDSKEIFLQDGAVQFIHSKGDEFIICGAMISPVNEEGNFDFIKRAQEVCGIDFLLKEIRPEQNVYSVPYCNIFAQDSEFFYTIINDCPHSDESVCCINKKTLEAFDTAFDFKDFIQAVFDGRFERRLNKQLTDIMIFPNRKEAQKHIKISKIADFLPDGTAQG